MKVLLLNQYFLPDVAATAQLVGDLALDLASAGCEVSVVASRGAYVGRSRYPKYEAMLGVDVYRVAATAFGRATNVGRLSDYFSFGVCAVLQLMRIARPDVVIAMSTPPMLSILGAAQKILSGVRFVYWVQDLYPDIAVKLGVLEERSPATFALERFSRLSLHCADAVVAIGDTMAERLVSRGVDRKKIAVIHNWSDGAEIGTISANNNWFIDRHCLRGKFVVLYSGNMGRGHEFGTLLAAAERMRDRKDVVFLFVGDGAKRKEIERAAVRCPNVRLLPYQPREDLPYSLGSAGLMVITLSDGLEGMIVPSKLYGALAARKPVLFVGPENSDVARIVREEGCGAAVAHGDVDAVCTFIDRLAIHPDDAVAMGIRGRNAFERRFDRKISTAAFAELCARLYDVKALASMN